MSELKTLKDEFRLLTLKKILDVRHNIKLCQKKNHVQQVAYSTYHDCLTQICFTCGDISTNLKEEDLK